MPHGEHLARRDVNVTSHDVGDMTSSGDVQVDAHDDDDPADETGHGSGASMETLVWKGLVVLAGIYVFFVTERLISLCRTARRHSDEVMLRIYDLYIG